MREAFEYGTELLNKRGLDEVNANIEIFLSDLLGCSRSEIKQRKDVVLTSLQRGEYNKFLERRLIGEPLQYIMGVTNFYGYDIKLDQNVLIPRPETEQLVEKVLDDIKKSGRDEVSILEVGTGSGCISIALAKELQNMEINYHITATDVSSEALGIANENLVLNNLTNGRISLILEDFLNVESISNDTDYLVSNPPYISINEYKELPVEILDFEPEVSLTDEADGLTFYKKIIELTKDKPNGFKIFCEIGFGQNEDIEVLLKSTGIRRYFFHKDYNGIDRVMEAEI